MKAVIVEIQGQIAAALDENGIVTSIPNQDYTIGQTISLSENIKIRKFTSARRIAVAAAVAFVVLIGGTAAFGTIGVNDSGAQEFNMADSQSIGGQESENYDQVKDGIKEELSLQKEMGQQVWEENESDWSRKVDQFNEWGKAITEDIIDFFTK